MKAAIYARVSTEDQNCEMQLSELRQYCATRGWSVHAEYVDTGVSGSKASRPQLDKLMKDARARRFDCVVAWKLDRWARSLMHTVHSLQELSAAGVRFVAVTQGIDTDNNNPMARFMTNILSVFAELERDLIRERVAAGVNRYCRDFAAGKASSRSGKNLPIGRPKVIFRRDEAIRLRAAGQSWRAIAKQLGVPVSTVVRGCTENPCAETSKDQSKIGTLSATA